MPFRLVKVLSTHGEHLIDHVEPDDGTFSAAEVSELQNLHSAADSYVQHGRTADEIARIDGAAAAVIHLQHAVRDNELGQLPDGSGSAAQTLVGIEGRFFIEITCRRVIHGVNPSVCAAT